MMVDGPKQNETDKLNALVAKPWGFPGEDDDEMERSRRIWLRLARYVVEKEQDIKQAMKFLEQCQGLVKIEDILPFFPGGNTNTVFFNRLQCNQVC